MAVTKILPRNGGLKEAIDYVLNGDKTDGHILTAHFNCDPGREYREMMKTKLETGRLDNRVSADLPDYIMDREIVRAALRTAKEADATDQEWQEFIDRITQRAKKSKEGGEIDA